MSQRSRKVITAVMLCLLLAACGADTPTVPAGPPEAVEIEAEEGAAQTVKIRLNGEVIPWNRFPIPEAEAFGLTGEDAGLYEAAVSQFNREETPEYFASDSINTDLILPAVNVFGSYTADEGNTVYVAGFLKYFFFDLGSGLADLNNPVYTMCTV